MVTRLDFADWEGDLASTVDDRASPVTTATTPSESERRGRKILTPRIVERRALDVRPRRAGGSSQPVTIVFRARDESGTWMTAHEVVVESDPRKEARNRQATFYDKNLRKLTPAQCFEAAIEDESSISCAAPFLCLRSKNGCRPIFPVNQQLASTGHFTRITTRTMTGFAIQEADSYSTKPTRWQYATSNSI